MVKNLGRKTNYNISTINGIETVTGYIFSTGKYNFGVTNRSENKKYPDWSVTELNTGFLACICAKTRSEAISNILTILQDKEKVNKIEKAIKTHPCVNPDISIKHVILSAINYT